MEASHGGGRRRRKEANGVVVAAGSVWETRMKLDEFKVFKSEEEEEEDSVDNNSSPEMDNNKQQQSTTTSSPEMENKKLNFKPKQSGVSPASSSKRKTWTKTESPVQIAKQRSQTDGIKKTPPSQINKTRSNSLVSPSGVDVKTHAHTPKKSPIHLSKGGVKLNPNKPLDDNDNDDDDGNDLKKTQLEKTKEMVPVDDGSIKILEEDCKELVVCEDKAAITSNFKSKEEDEVEIEKKSLIVKEMTTTTTITTTEQKKPKKIVIEKDNNFQQSKNNERPSPISPIVINNVRVHHYTQPNNGTTAVPEEVHRVPRQHRRLQRLVDIVMWKDIARSAFIFGVGTFLIISSSYTQDLNISIISVLSYLGLVYLAAIFLFRSLISRGATSVGNTRQEHVIGEEEAIWLMKLILPYVNEFFLSLRALFSGEPATTMKMAVLLFVLARCGSSITIWKMTKLGFFGVFILPKVCSSYSTQITQYGTFWIRRFLDAWESCSHKRALAFGVFTLVWNLSSIVARIWAVFVLFVALKYYQQSMMMGEGNVQLEMKKEESLKIHHGKGKWKGKGNSVDLHY